MLKIRSQLNRALQYQTVLGTERAVGHFDDSAKSFTGEPNNGQYREPLKDRKAHLNETVPNRMRVRRDAASGCWVGYYADRVE